MKSSCIAHPEREPLVIIRKWQVEFCDGNQCAAAVMAYFEYWHNWKLDSDEYNKKSNDVSELHGDTRSLAEDIYQFHSMQEISDGILNLYGVKAIAEAIKLLELKKVIKTQGNPNPRYFYDKKKYLNFYPEVCNEWIKNHYKSRLGKNAECTQQKSVFDSLKTPNALGKNAALLGENAVAITEINNKEINKTNKGESDFDDGQKKLTESVDDSKLDVQPIIDLLTQQGFPAERIQYPDDVVTLQRLREAGATTNVFIAAYMAALNATQKTGRTFGIPYLAKAVEELLRRKQHQSSVAKPLLDSQHHLVKSVNDESDFSNGKNWLGDICDGDE
jgi:hypothetical protein